MNEKPVNTEIVRETWGLSPDGPPRRPRDGDNAHEVRITLWYALREIGRLRTALAEEEDRGICTWRQDSDGNWDTSCSELFTFFSDGPVENRMNFCPYCGCLLRVDEEEKANG